MNDRLTSQLNQYNKTHKHPKYQAKTLDEVFAKEKDFLVRAPILFDGCKETYINISNTCLAMFDRNSYSVGCAVACKAVTCKAYADKLVFIYDGTEVGRHVRRFTKGETYYNWLHYLPILAHKPGALKNGIPFKDMPLPDELLAVRSHLQTRTQGSRDFAHILSYIPAESLESVVSACSVAIKSNTISKDVILNILLRKKDEPGAIYKPTNIIHIKQKIAPTDDCSRYNQLLKVGV